MNMLPTELSLNYSKKKIIAAIIIIGLISLGLKLITFDPSLLPPEDTFGYTLRAISHSNGIFLEPERKTLGWSLVASPFISLVNSDNFLDYVNTLRILSLSISLFTIVPMYVLGRKFFNEKYALVSSLLFALLPDLNYNSSQGLSEPIYILCVILAMNFILSRNDKITYLAFIMSGFAWMMRWPGILIFIITSIIYFLNSGISTRTLLKYSLCFFIFLIVVSPMLINRYAEYEDPLYFSQTPQLFTGDYSRLLAENTKDIEYSASQYIEDNGILSFLEKFLGEGLTNIGSLLLRITFPFLIILFPIGIFFSIRPFDQNTKFIRSLWIMILISLFSMITYIAVVPEKRLLFSILPFIIIIGTIPIQRLIQYGLSTFSFTNNMKNIALITIILFIIALSLFATLRYDLVDNTENKERIQFGDYLTKNLKGNIIDAGNTLQGLSFSQLSYPVGNFKTFDPRLNDNNLQNSLQLIQISIHGETLNSFILNSELNQVKYISISEKGITEQWYPFLSEVYDNEEKYPYLEKIFDSEENGYDRFKVKVFEINYDIFKDGKK